MSVQDAKSSLKILVANAQLSVAFDPLVVISELWKIWGVFVFKFWGLRGLWGLCFQDTPRGRCGTIFRLKWKLCKPSITRSELQQSILLDGIVHPADLPSKSEISKCIREDLVMTKKKIQQVPIEAKKPINVEHINFFLDQVSDLPPTTIHFFDESSAVKTAMNNLMEIHRSEDQVWSSEICIKWSRTFSSARMKTEPVRHLVFLLSRGRYFANKII